jgi:hypothetical protein
LVETHVILVYHAIYLTKISNLWIMSNLKSKAEIWTCVNYIKNEQNYNKKIVLINLLDL